MKNDIMTFSVFLRPGDPARPKRGNEVIWLNDQGTREFGGVVTIVTETDLGGDLQYDVQCASYDVWFNRRLVINYYSSMTADAMIKQIVSQFCPGFTTNNVQPSYVVPPFYANYIEPSKAIEKILQSIGWGYYIDYYKDLHAYSTETFVSPLPGNTLNLDTDVTNYSDCQIVENGSQIKNRIFLKGFKSRVSTPVTLTFTGDGNTTQWSLGYKPSRLNGDLTITVGGTNMTIKRDLVDGAPGQNTTDTTSAYVNYSQNMFRLNYAPASGVVIKCTMYYLSDMVVLRSDPTAMQSAAAADNDGTNGAYEYAHTEQSLSQATLSAANARGDELLLKYGYPTVTGTFNSFTQGWRAGQRFVMTSKRRMGGINDTFYVLQAKKTIVKADNNGLLIQYAISFGDTPYLTV